MKKKSFIVLLAASVLALSASACGADNQNPSGQEQPEVFPIDEGAESGAQETDSEENETENSESTEAADNSDTDVTNDTLNESAGDHADASSVSVTFEENTDEYKAEDGTVIFTNSVQKPVVHIEGAEDIAEKINADLTEYYAAFSTDNNETLNLAKEDYAASQGEDGWDFLGYASDVSAKATRLDDSVISFQITLYDFTGGAHGNYGSACRNYSAKTGELLALDEIAEDSEAFHATALDYMINLADTPAYKDRLFGPPSKTDLDDALFQTDHWVFTESGISFLAAPYVLGPYASGEIAFRLPYEKAYDLGLKEDYRYNGNFVEERYYICEYDSETFEPVVDGTPDYYFDLDGDGTEEELAFYGEFIDPAIGESRYAFYIDGKDWGDVVQEALGGATSDNSYIETTYALYDSDPSDGLTEIAVLFTEYDNTASETNAAGQKKYSYLFRYTPEKELQFAERADGYVTEASTQQ